MLGGKGKAGFGPPSLCIVMLMRLVILNAVTPDLYKYKALRLSYENASIFATFALVAFIPGLPYTHLVILETVILEPKAIGSSYFSNLCFSLSRFSPAI